MLCRSEMCLIWAIGLLSVCLINHGSEALFQFPSEEQPYRTAFHFQPPKNWMNDPNGPMYYNGVYHLFYQYNPYSAVWGNISWAHSVSYDLVNWVHLDIALSPAHPYDINGCWSGSATSLPGNKPAILYTGIDTQSHQVQNLAVPKNLSDPLLREWTKSPNNPLISPGNDTDPKSFRDPTTAWLGPDGLWRVLVGAEVSEARNGATLLYKSRDFVTWQRAESPLHSSAKTGMWECPDFYPVIVDGSEGSESYYPANMAAVKHVLKASLKDRDYYILGRYVAETDAFVPETEFLDAGSDLRYDYGKAFYASKSFYDGEKWRRVLWSWIRESDAASDDVSEGWSGLQSIPRSIVLSSSGRQLVQWPIEEIESLRSDDKVSLGKKKLEGGSVVEISLATASQADVEVSFDVVGLEEAELMEAGWDDPQVLCSQKNTTTRGKFGPFGLLVLASKGFTEQTAIFFRILKSRDKYVVLMCSDQSRSSLREGLDKTIFGAFVDLDPLKEKITLRSLIDRSIVESFGGEGRTCMTSRVYPKLAIGKEAYLYAFNYGTKSVEISELNAWTMKNAKIFAVDKRRRPKMV